MSDSSLADTLVAVAAEFAKTKQLNESAERLLAVWVRDVGELQERLLRAERRADDLERRLANCEVRP